MQVFFAISCVLAALALSNGASIASNSEREVDQPRAEVEAQDAVVAASEETAGQSRAAEVQANEEAAADAGTSDGAAVELRSAAVEPRSTAATSTSGNKEADGAARGKRTLLHHHLMRKGCGGGCSGIGGCDQGCATSGQLVMNPCLQPGGCGSGCGGAIPCAPTDFVVVPRPVPVAQPVHIPVPIVKVVRHPVPVPQPVAVPVTKFVPVPVPVKPLQMCCNQAPLPCSPCSG